MFKKKASLPARPPIPSKEEILEDLTRATPEDVVFNMDIEAGAPITDECDYLTPKFIEKTENHDALDKFECNNPHQAYIKVASFVDKVNNLEKYLVDLRKSKDSLKLLEKGLKADMTKVEEELKKQSESPDEN